MSQHPTHNRPNIYYTMHDRPNIYYAIYDSPNTRYAYAAIPCAQCCKYELEWDRNWIGM